VGVEFQQKQSLLS